MKRQLSKMAGYEEIGLEILNELWRFDLGPLANVFNLMSFLAPFVPGLGWSALVLSQIGSLFGWGPIDLGKYLDEELGFGPGSNLNMDAGKMTEEITDAISAKFASKSENGLTKEAFFGIGFVTKLLIKYIPAITRNITKALTLILLATKSKDVADIYNKKKELISALTDKLDSEELGIENMLGMGDMLSDPSKIMEAFGLGGKQ